MMTTFPRWFPSTGAWWEDRGKHYWEGPEQKENRSPENIRRCYAFLLSVPYLTLEDREHLKRLGVIAAAEAEMLAE